MGLLAGTEESVLGMLAATEESSLGLLAGTEESAVGLLAQTGDPWQCLSAILSGVHRVVSLVSQPPAHCEPDFFICLIRFICS